MRDDKQHKRKLVLDTAEQLRKRILSCEPETQIGSLTELAEQLGVGIVTVQQAARILEHEGMLSVKRGPGGGYYGTRPDDAAIERAFATYMRIHKIGHSDAFELTVLLDCEIIKAAAANRDGQHQEQMEALLAQLLACDSSEASIEFELDFRRVLLQTFNRPLLELLSRVAMQLYHSTSDTSKFGTEIGLDLWRKGRERILRAIMNQDPELAYFEAQRFRQMVLSWMAEPIGKPSN